MEGELVRPVSFTAVDKSEVKRYGVYLQLEGNILFVGGVSEKKKISNRLTFLLKLALMPLAGEGQGEG